VTSVLQIVLVTAVLSVVGGLSQALPWGLGSARQFRQVTVIGGVNEFGSARSAVVDVAANPLVTDEFDRLAVNQVSTLTTDHSFAWIVSKPIGYYRPARYLGVEIATQCLVATGLVALTAALDRSSTGTTIFVTFLAAVVAAVATYGQLTNWWGLTMRYAAGVSLTLIASWVTSVMLVTTIWR
jgi:hypothetical protein